MTNSKSTKRALLSSSLAIVLCVAMLIGATYAWFTDTASTAVNKIQAGTLDVALEMKNADGEWVSAEGETLQFKKAADADENEKVLWEPGCTYELPELRVVNKGNLALKYKMIITGIDGDAELNKAIEWTYTRLTQIGESETYTIGEETKLAAGATDSAITIKGHMDENAGNEYQGLTIDGISVTVVATQATVEHDSYDNQYDKDAEYNPKLITAEELKNLFVNEDGTLKSEVTLDKDYLLTDTWAPLNYWVPDGPTTPSVTVDGQGHTIYNMRVNGESELGFIGSNNIKLTIKDLTFSNATVVGSGSFLGVVIGYQYGDVTLENVQVENSVVKSTNEKGIRIGGLVGFSVLHDETGNVKLTLKNCAVKNSTFEGYHNTCGLVGTLKEYSTRDDQFEISDCTVSGCKFLWGSTNTKYNNYAVCEGYPYNAQYNVIINGVTATGNTFEYKK